MQGELSEIDIRSILQLIELGQRTGELFVEAYVPGSSYLKSTDGLQNRDLNSPWVGKPLTYSAPCASWFVFFIQGRIIYTSDNSMHLRRLRDYLRRYDRESALDQIDAPPITTTHAPEYGHLWFLLEHHLLSPKQCKSIVRGMVRETLFDLLGLHQGSFIFETSSPLSPPLMNVEFSASVGHIMQQVQAWKQLHPHIQSPEQCPSIDDHHEALRNSLKPSTYQTLKRWTDTGISIRQLSRYLNRDILSVAKALYPYVRKGIVQLSPPPYPVVFHQPEKHIDQARRTPHVLCIDDGATYRQAVEIILQERGYEITAIGDPLQALSLAFRIKPDLILCDIAMPELNGYEVCAMLRKSTAFRQIPIVMLTGKDGFIDRVKARMVGANEYLTKPFSDQELIMVVERYLGVALPSSPSTPPATSESAPDPLSSPLSDSSTDGHQHVLPECSASSISVDTFKP